MVVYSLFVSGEYDIFDDVFKCHSKNVYMNKPTQKDIDEFIEKCTSGGFGNLDIKKPYEVQVIEHPVIDNLNI